MPQSQILVGFYVHPVLTADHPISIRLSVVTHTHLSAASVFNLEHIQGRRADKKLARGEVPPLLLKIDGVVGLETAFAFLKMAPGS